MKTLIITIIYFLASCSIFAFELHKIENKLPNLFLKDIVSTGMNEFGSSFTPDYKYLYYCIRHRSDIFTIVELKDPMTNPHRTVIASFSGIYNDADPFITKDGKYLYFCSDRPTSINDTIRDWNIWRVEKIKEQWTNLQALEFNSAHKNEMYPTVSLSGNLYFHADYNSQSKYLDFGKTDLYCSKKLTNGKYSQPELLTDLSSSEYPEWDPYISPDESFLIFTTNKPGGYGSGDMYISYYNKLSNKWGIPVNLGPKINSDGMDYCPNITWDGKYLFYSSYRNSIKHSYTNYEDLKKNLNGAQNGNGDIYYIEISQIKSSEENIKDVIKEAYIDGIFLKGDSELIRKGWDNNCNIIFMKEGKVSSLSIKYWIERFTLKPGPLDSNVTYEIKSINISSFAATVILDIYSSGKKIYTDHMNLYQTPDGWKIVSKIYCTYPN